MGFATFGLVAFAVLVMAPERPLQPLLAPLPEIPQQLAYDRNRVKLDADEAMQTAVTHQRHVGALGSANSYFLRIDTADYEGAVKRWAADDPVDLDLLTATRANLSRRYGALTRRTLAIMAWRKDPQGQLPGVYVMMGYTAAYQGADLACGYLVMREEENSNFAVVRERVAVVSNEVRDNRAKNPKAFEEAWAGLERDCIELPAKPTS